MQKREHPELSSCARFAQCLFSILAMTTALLAGTPVALFTDNFTVVTPDGQSRDLNFNFDVAGRQDGLLSPLPWESWPGIYLPGMGSWVGITNHPHGGCMVLGVRAGAGLNCNFNGARSAGGLRFAFDLSPNPDMDDISEYGQFTLGLHESFRNSDETSGFSLVFWANGGLQAFDSGVLLAETNWVSYGNYMGQLHHFELLITDPGDGNPFDGAGVTKVELFVDGGMTNVYAFSKSGGYADDYVNFRAGWKTVDIDNFSITQIDPPPPPLSVVGVRQFGQVNALTLTWTFNGVGSELQSSGSLTGAWSTVSSPWVTNGNIISTTVTNKVPAEFFRLRRL